MSGINWEMGVSNPLQGINQGLASLGQALQYSRQQARQSDQDKMAMSLHDLQMQKEQIALDEAKRGQDLQTGLRERLAGLQPTTKFVAEGALPQLASLGQLPGQTPVMSDANPSVFNTPGKMVTTQPNIPAETAKYYMEKGDLAKAATAISLDDNLAQYEAKVKQGGGDIREYYAAKTKLDRMKEFAEAVKPYVGKPGMMQAMWPSIVEAFPEAKTVDPMKFKTDGQNVMHPFVDPTGKEIPGMFYVYDQDGKMQIKEVKPDAEALLDKRLAATAAENEKNRAAADARLQKTLSSKTMGVNINGLTPEENAALDRAIQNGLDPYKVNSRTGKIYAQQELLNPGRDWNKLGAQAAFERSQTTMNTRALLNTVNPLLDKLEQAGAVLGNSSMPGYNKAVNFLKEQTGQADIVGFNNLRDDVVAEVERGLLGTGVLSDSKYLRAVKNINSAQSLPQLKAAVANTKMVISARLESLAKGPNPTPPNQGENAAKGGKKDISSFWNK